MLVGNNMVPCTQVGRICHELAHEKRKFHDVHFEEAMRSNFVKVLSYLKTKPSVMAM